MYLERIDELINEFSITRAELERESGLVAGTLRNWNRSTPSIDKVQKVADYFGVSVDYLLGTTNVRKMNNELDSQDLADLLENVTTFNGKLITEKDKIKIKYFLLGIMNGE
jgi:Helix-turn-helix.